MTKIKQTYFNQLTRSFSRLKGNFSFSTQKEKQQKCQNYLLYF